MFSFIFFKKKQNQQTLALLGQEKTGKCRHKLLCRACFKTMSFGEVSDYYPMNNDGIIPHRVAHFDGYEELAAA